MSAERPALEQEWNRLNRSFSRFLTSAGKDAAPGPADPAPHREFERGLARLNEQIALSAEKVRRRQKSVPPSSTTSSFRSAGSVPKSPI